MFGSVWMGFGVGSSEPVEARPVPDVGPKQVDEGGCTLWLPLLMMAAIFFGAFLSWVLL